MADKNKRNKRYQLPKNRIVIPLIIYILVFMFASAVISLSGDLIATYATKIKALTEVENTAKLAKLYNDAPADGLDMVFDDINKSGYKVFVTDSKLNVIRNDESTGEITAELIKDENDEKEHKSIFALLPTSNLKENEFGFFSNAYAESMTENFFLFPDKNDPYLNVDDTIITPNMMNIISGALNNKIGVNSEYEYWTAYNVRNNTEIIAFKTKLYFTYSDFAFCILYELVSYILISLIFILLVVTLIRTHRSNRQMRNLVLRDNITGNRNWFWFALSLLMCAGSMTYAKKVRTSGNPLFQGWYADPEAIVLNGRCWVFPTYSAPYDEQLFFDAFSSKDLVTWKKHPRVLTSEQVSWARRAMWAPAVVKKGRMYYLFFSANDVHEGEVGGIGVAVSKKPQGPYKDALGKPLIQHVVNGAQPIDQYVFRDDDGQYYMYYGGWGHCNVVRLADDLLSVVPFPDGTIYKEVTPEHYVEGPFMLKRDGKYYFMWSEGGWGLPNYCVSYAISDSPLGPFRRIGKILEQDAAVATGAGHHSVIKGKGDDWYIVYHRRPLGETAANSRVTCIDKLEFDANGLIRPVRITKEGVQSAKLK